MSIFHPANITCPKCGTSATVNRSGSVNADRRPDLREAILKGSFQATHCSKCGTLMRLPPHLVYLDIGRGSWIAVEPTTMLEQWPDVEQDVFEVYAHAFGDEASVAAREIGEDLLPRLVFGWAALREKLICQDLGLDDTTLELLKMAIMRDVDSPPVADETELRLVGGDTENLEFQWIAALSENPIAALSVPRDVYDGIVADPVPWDVARGTFESVFLVDLRRLIAGPREPAAAA
jgi:hypothetical protein